MMNFNRMYCQNCIHWEWDDNIILQSGSKAYPGHCALVSGSCINDVANGKVPRHFQKLEVTADEDQG